MTPNKPRALLFVSPSENRSAYFSAGLSHFYKLDLYYTRDKNFFGPTFYQWLYAKDTAFYPVHSLDDILKAQNSYDLIIVQQDALGVFLKMFINQDTALEFLKKLKPKAKKFFWFEPGERLYFYCGRPEFWDLFDGVIKHHVLKKQFAHFLRDEKKAANFQSPDVPNYAPFVAENKNFQVENYYDKIIPYPFPPGLTDHYGLRWKNHKKIYDISGNTRGFSYQQTYLRSYLMDVLKRKLNPKFSYCFDYGSDGYVSNLSTWRRSLNPYLFKPFRIGELAFRLQYRKFVYPKPLYFHNLANSKTYFGLGAYFSATKTADAWQSGAVLFNWSFEKCDYGIPMVDGYNYVSVGERDEMSDDNYHLQPEFEDKIVSKVESVLNNEALQNSIRENQFKTYFDYYSSPAQFVKKIFIDKLKNSV